MAKLLRVTRHPAGESQAAELRRIFGDDLEIVQIDRKFAGAAEVKALVEEHSPVVAVEATLPIAMIAELTARGGLQVPLIRAITWREEVEGQPTVFHFDHYEKVVKVEMVTEVL